MELGLEPQGLPDVTLVLWSPNVAQLQTACQLPSATSSFPPIIYYPEFEPTPSLRVQAPTPTPNLNTHWPLSPEFLSFPLRLQPRSLCNQLLRDLFIGLVAGTFSHNPDPDLAICPQQPLDVLVTRCLTTGGRKRRKEKPKKVRAVMSEE